VWLVLIILIRENRPITHLLNIHYISKKSICTWIKNDLAYMWADSIFPIISVFQSC